MGKLIQTKVHQGNWRRTAFNEGKPDGAGLLAEIRRIQDMFCRVVWSTSVGAPLPSVHYYRQLCRLLAARVLSQAGRDR